MSHPLDSFKYCPRCGAAHFAENDSRSKHCSSCGFTYYHNSSAATVAVILNDRKELLVTRRAFQPAKGTLDLPGGFVDPLESLEEGCLREVLEETGARGKIMDYLFSIPNTYCYSNFEVHTVDSFFRCQLLEGQVIRANDDAEALFWMPLSDIKIQDFGLSSIRQGLERLQELL